MRPLRISSALLVVLLLLASCATATKTLLVTGESLDQLGKQFVSVGKQWNSLYDAKAITADQYKEWATFAVWFKAAYPEAVSLWKTARATNDTAATAAIEDSIGKMAAELTRLGLKVYTMLKPPGRT